MNNYTYLCYFSVILLAFVCFIDFKNHIPKAKPAWPYYVALTLFVLANSAIYVSLLPFLTGIELNIGNMPINKVDRNIPSDYQIISPVIIAILYFGFGKAKIEIGGKEYAFYGMVLNLFKSMFPRSLGVTRKLGEYIDKLGDETENLKNTVTTMQEVAEDNKWTMYKDEWSEIKSTTEIIENEIHFLKNIKSSISDGSKKILDIKNTQYMIDDQIEKSTLNMNNKIRKYLKKLIKKNILHEESIDEIAHLINVKNTSEIIHKKRSSCIARAFGVSFFCGILLSIALTAGNKPIDFSPNEMVFYLVASFFVFLSFFAAIDRLDMSINGFSIALFMGAIGGFCGHSAFNIISKNSKLFGLFSHKEQIEMSIYDTLKAAYDILKTASMEPTLGIVIGVFSACILYFFKNFVNKIVESSAIKYMLVSISGGIMVLSVCKIVPGFSFGDDFYAGTICPAITGIIVLIGTSFVSGIFEKKS